MEQSIAAEPTELRREDLYEQVWSEPMVRVANRYGISDVALAKICRKMDIPVPPRGYWRRIETGRRPPRPPLRKLRPGVRRAVELTVRPDSPDTPTSDPEVEAQEAFERDAENRIRVPRQLADPHPLVNRLATVLRKARPGLFGTVRAFGEKCLDVRRGYPEHRAGFADHGRPRKIARSARLPRRDLRGSQAGDPRRGSRSTRADRAGGEDPSGPRMCRKRTKPTSRRNGTTNPGVYNLRPRRRQE